MPGQDLSSLGLLDIFRLNFQPNTTKQNSMVFTVLSSICDNFTDLPVNPTLQSCSDD